MNETIEKFLDGFHYVAELFNEYLQDECLVATCKECKKMYEMDEGYDEAFCSHEHMTEYAYGEAEYNYDPHFTNGVSERDFF